MPPLVGWSERRLGSYASCIHTARSAMHAARRLVSHPPLSPSRHSADAAPRPTPPDAHEAAHGCCLTRPVLRARRPPPAFTAVRLHQRRPRSPPGMHTQDLTYITVHALSRAAVSAPRSPFRPRGSPLAAPSARPPLRAAILRAHASPRARAPSHVVARGGGGTNKNEGSSLTDDGR